MSLIEGPDAPSSVFFRRPRPHAWRRAFGAPARHVLGVPDDQVIVSGMTLGHADCAAAENSLVTERAPPDEFAIRRT